MIIYVEFTKIYVSDLECLVSDADLVISEIPSYSNIMKGTGTTEEVSETWAFGASKIEEVSSGEEMLVGCSGTDMLELSMC